MLVGTHTIITLTCVTCAPLSVYRSQEILLSFDVYCNSLLVDQLRSKPEQENNEITVALYTWSGISVIVL